MRKAHRRITSAFGSGGERANASDSGGDWHPLHCSRPWSQRCRQILTPGGILQPCTRRERSSPPAALGHTARVFLCCLCLRRPIYFYWWAWPQIRLLCHLAGRSFFIWLLDAPIWLLSWPQQSQCRGDQRFFFVTSHQECGWVYYILKYLSFWFFLY
jgi:hypothetical protein